MGRPTKFKGGASQPIAFRVSKDEYAEFQDKCQRAGMSASEFFRDYILTNKPVVEARTGVYNKAELRRLLFLVNKTSNNINQLAHRANSDHLAGKLTENNYINILKNLESINLYLKAMCSNVG